MWEELKLLLAEAKLPFELNLSYYFDSTYGSLQKPYPDQELKVLTAHYDDQLPPILTELTALQSKAASPGISSSCRSPSARTWPRTKSQRCASYWQGRT
jgi:hypothetical protein